MATISRALLLPARIVARLLPEDDAVLEPVAARITYISTGPARARRAA